MVDLSKIIDNEGISIDIVEVAGTDLSIVNSARVSFGSMSKCEGFPAKIPKRDKKLINYLAKHRHMSPFRHNSISFRCKAPIYLARQLAKHQVGGAWNEISRRYVDSPPSFYLPEWRKRPEKGIKQGSSLEVTDLEACSWYDSNDDYYIDFLAYCMSVYSDFLTADVAPEVARSVLPQSMVTEWIWTGSLEFFFNVWKQRSDFHAQKEARMFAEKLDKHMKVLFPEGWKALKEHSK